MALTTEAETNEIDVRSLVPMQRHQKIFELVDQLAPGGKFILVNDHAQATLLPAGGRTSAPILLDLSREGAGLARRDRAPLEGSVRQVSQRNKPPADFAWAAMWQGS
ncbi:DUF2249 domain-containing protein [Mesorhizobium qingshengii]|uniref:Uncharacterized conserved protein n=1 Tax=Mesorhizobium qingshengii TaxID=1165689 RepID=A0A1G5ZDD3_9HYPH|nr:Uncharacterized conserved protein [Mesorhizobium qingshengii]